MSRRKRNGKIVMIAGGILILAALAITLYNVYTENAAGAAANEVLSELNMDGIAGDYAGDYRLNPDIPLPVKTIDGIEYVGTITIPKIDKILPVVAQWSTANSKIAPCVYEGTPYKDNMIIAGHNYKTHFGPIDNLKQGDTVIFEDMDGNVFNYRVLYTELIDGSDTESMIAGQWDLTLFTCNYSGGSRITVRCKLEDKQYTFHY